MNLFTFSKTPLTRATSFVMTLALTVVLSGGIFVPTAFAATTGNLTPFGQGADTSWGGTESDVDEGVASCAGGDYISEGTTGDRESVNIDLSSIPDGSTITSVSVMVHDQAASAPTSGGTYQTYVSIDGPDTDSGVTLSSDSTKAIVLPVRGQRPKLSTLLIL